MCIAGKRKQVLVCERCRINHRSASRTRHPTPGVHQGGDVMPIDVAVATGAEPRKGEISWTHKDVILYHLGVGAGTPATDADELRYTYEKNLQVLPTFCTVAG